MPNYEKAAERAARRYGLNPKIFKAMIRQESGFRPDAKSGAGAQGIAQFIPSTARAYGVNLNDNRASDDLDGAARYLRDNLRKYGDYHRALSVYNSGRPDAYKDPGFAGGQTYNYVRSILGGAKGEHVSGGSLGAAPSMPGQSGPSYRTVPGVDNSATRQELKLAYFQNSHDPNALLQLKSGLDQAQDEPSRRVRIRGARSSSPKTGGGKAGGVAHFDGKPVLAKFLPELRWARKHGWTGTVTSGVRTKSQQLSAAKSFGLQHYGPAGPLGSNHVQGHRGAVDVSNPDELDQILARYPGRRRLKRGMADDPVHFSPTGH